MAHDCVHNAQMVLVSDICAKNNYRTIGELDD